MKMITTTKTISILCLIWSLPLLVACSTPAGNPENGKKWFSMHNCSSCHGPHGNDGKAPNIRALAMGFGSFERKLRKTDAPIMPAYPESKISRDDAGDLYAFLKTPVQK